MIKFLSKVMVYKMLGQKRYTGRKIGEKFYLGKSIGQKFYNGSSSNPINNLVKHTPDGIIHNYSNSNEVAKEPMYGVPINAHRKKFIEIEKSKKSHGSKNDKFA
jgi:hypothetical protein